MRTSTRIAIPLLGLAASPALAGITTIDGFDSAPAGTFPFVGNANASVAIFGFQYLDDVLSGVRYLEVQRGQASAGTGPDPVLIDIGQTDTPGVTGLSIETPDFYAATTFLLYGFVPPGPDVPAFNFAGSDAFVLDIATYSAPTGGALSVRAEVYDNFGEVWSTTVAFDMASGRLVIPFASFQLVDFSNIDDLVFTINSPRGADFVIDTIGVRNVPGPSTLCMALAGVVATRRRRG